MPSRLIVSRSKAEEMDGRVPTSAQFDRLQDLFEKSFKAAGVGIWECSLPDETLTWTDTVFELFELDPQVPLQREDIVALYTPKSKQQLTQVRSAAIRDGEGFSLDAEIVTAKGNTRWIRISAVVERVNGTPSRIFGMKQDVTAEKQMFDHFRRLAEIDAMTGLASRAKFETVFEEVCAGQDAPASGFLLIDLNGFKALNDTLGHQSGDACLVHTARKLATALPKAQLIARLGGDEFGVIHACASPVELQTLGNRIVETLESWWGTYPDKLKVSASVGGALIGQHASPKDVFASADRALYAAKANGKQDATQRCGNAVVSAA